MTEEFMEPARRSKRYLWSAYAALAIGFLLLQYWGMPAVVAYVKSLALCDQIAALEKITFAVMCLPAAMGVWGVCHARKLIEHEQIPLPGAWVFRRTAVKRSRMVRCQAYVLLVISFVLTVLPFAGGRFMDPVFMSLDAKHQCAYNVSIDTDASRRSSPRWASGH